MSKLKNYEKQRYSGNENGWHEPIVGIGVTAIDEATAAELNSHFRNTGVKYEPTSKNPYDGEVTINEADHGEHGLAVDNGKLKTTSNKPEAKAKAAVDDAKKKKKVENKKDLADTKPKDIATGDAAVLSDGTTKATILDTDENGRIEGDNKPPALDSTAGQ